MRARKKARRGARSVVGSGDAYRELGASGGSAAISDEARPKILDRHEEVVSKPCREGEGELLDAFPAGMASRLGLARGRRRSSRRQQRPLSRRSPRTATCRAVEARRSHGSARPSLEVLDRPEQSAFSLAEMDLLGLFANQAAIAVDLLLRARQAERLLDGGEDELSSVARLASIVAELQDERREAAIRLLDDLSDTLATKR